MHPRRDGAELSILAIDGSPRGGGRTSLVLDAVLGAAKETGASTAILSLADGPAAISAAVTAISDYDAFVMGAPAYRAAPASPLKAFLDAVPREFVGDFDSPFRAKPVAVVITGSTYHHYLAIDGLRSVLAGFFAAHVLSPGLYVAAEGFADGALTESTAAAAEAQGRSLVALASAVAGSAELRRIHPQI